MVQTWSTSNLMSVLSKNQKKLKTCRGGRWGWTAVTLGARWPLLCHPFVLYIGKTWPSHGPNMAHFKSDVISVKNFKKFKNEFRVKFGARVKIKLQIVFKTINFIYPENLCLSGLFLSKEELHEINAPLPQ